MLPFNRIKSSNNLILCALCSLVANCDVFVTYYVAQAEENIFICPSGLPFWSASVCPLMTFIKSVFMYEAMQCSAISNERNRGYSGALRLWSSVGHLENDRHRVEDRKFEES